MLAFGRLHETLAPLNNEMLASLKQEKAGRLSLVLSNGGGKGQRPFSLLEARENMLGALGELAVGYSGLDRELFLPLPGPGGGLPPGVRADHPNP